MEFFNELIAVGWRKLGNRLPAPCIAGLVNYVLEFMDVHGDALSRQRSAVRAESISLTFLRSAFAYS
jgi:hypothetical protein